MPAPNPEIARCAVCIYWNLEADAQGDRGHCHRHAPQPSRDQITTFWPETLANQWCGDGVVSRLAAATPADPDAAAIPV